MRALGPDESTIRAAWRWLAHRAHGVSEVRVIRPAGGIIGIGFFDDEDAFVRECVRTNAAGNVYVGIQPRPRRLFDTAPNVVRPLKTGAGRKDIEVITATVIDLDPALRLEHNAVGGLDFTHARRLVRRRRAGKPHRLERKTVSGNSSSGFRAIARAMPTCAFCPAGRRMAAPQ